MQWLMGVFEASSDQARLVTTILAAIIAVSVVLLNQWFNTKRARKETLIKKIEEIYSAVIKMQLLKSTIHYEIVSGYPDLKKLKLKVAYSSDGQNKELVEWQRNLEEKRDEFSSLGAQAFMLTGLYFPSMQKDITNIWTTFDKLYSAYIESEEFSQYMVGASKHIDDINKLFEETFATLSSVMKETMH